MVVKINMSKLYHYDHGLRLCAKALQNGGVRHSLSRVSWDISQGCSRPYWRELVFRPEGGKDGTVTIGPGLGHQLVLEIETPCRSCDHCLKKRANLWTARAQSECQIASRTWFATLTLRPEAQQYYLAKARHAAAEINEDFDLWPEKRRFRHHVKQMTPEITRYFKRCRKKYTGRLRYLFVSEAHKSGHPHFHALIHEFGPTITERDLTRKWLLGFSKFRLVKSNREARYITKYLGKSLLARVRASRGYGSGLPHASPVKLINLTEEKNDTKITISN